MLFQHKELPAKTHLGGTGDGGGSSGRVHQSRRPRFPVPGATTCSGGWLQFQAFLIRGIQDPVLALPLRFSFLPEKHNPLLRKEVLCEVQVAHHRVAARLQAEPCLGGCCLTEGLFLLVSQLGKVATVICYSNSPHQFGKR